MRKAKAIPGKKKKPAVMDTGVFLRETHLNPHSTLPQSLRNNRSDPQEKLQCPLQPAAWGTDRTTRKESLVWSVFILKGNLYYSEDETLYFSKYIYLKIVATNETVAEHTEL